jgi:hypothetical protein
LALKSSNEADVSLGQRQQRAAQDWSNEIDFLNEALDLEYSQ